MYAETATAEMLREGYHVVTCQICRRLFVPRGKQQYCRDECYEEANRRKARERYRAMKKRIIRRQLRQEQMV
jgi:hypothetical protein